MNNKLIERKKSEFTCDYCGAFLSPLYYFCTNCGTPYRKATGIVYREVIPQVPCIEKRVSMQAKPSIALFCLLAVGLIGFSMLGMAIFGWERIDLSFYLQSAFIIILTFIFALVYWCDIEWLFKDSGFLNPYFFLGFLLLAGLLLLNFLYHGFLIEIFDLGNEESVIRTLHDKLDVSNTALIILICVIPAVFEELSFRALLQEWLMRCTKVWKACVGTAFLFMLLHFSFLSMPYLFLVGYFLCWMRIKTKSIYPVMIYHFLHNLIVLQYELLMR